MTRHTFIPITAGLKNSFMMHMYTQLGVLKSKPTEESWSGLAQIMNVVGMAMHGDKRRKADYIIVTSGVSAMQQIERKSAAGMRLNDHEFMPLQNAVNTISNALGKMDMTRLYGAMIKLNFLD